MISARSVALSSSPKSDQAHDLRFPNQLSPQEQRTKHLRQSCELLSASFDKLDSLMEEYLQEVPFSPRDTDRSDANRFLRWISSVTKITAEQQDLITCLKSRFAVEFISFKRRLAFHRFQELTARSERFIQQVTLDDKATLHLNPLHVWATFETHVLLDEKASVPATVLFYPNAQGVQTTVLGVAALAVVKRLVNGSLSIKKIFKSKTPLEKTKLTASIKDMLRLGILAIQ